MKIVLGINDFKLQERLLRTSDLSLDKIVDHYRATTTVRIKHLGC